MADSILDGSELRKKRLINAAILIILAGNSIATVIWVLRQRVFDMGVVSAIASLGMIALTLLPGFSWRTRAIVLVTNLTIVGLYFVAMLGVRYTALAIVEAGVVITATFFGRRKAFALLIFDTVAILTCGIFALVGWIAVPDLTLKNESLFMSWLRTAILFATLSTVLTVIVGGLVDALETGVARLKQSMQFSTTNEARYRQMFDYAPEAIVVFDIRSKKFVEANARAQRLLGYSLRELKELSPTDIAPEFQEDGRRTGDSLPQHIAACLRGESPVFESLHITKEGEVIPFEIRLQLMPGSENLQIRGTMIDMRERRKAQALIHNLALYDSLTGLPNRKLFHDRLAHALDTSERDKKYGAVLFIDVDNFKNINDALGHAAGDYFLTVVAERISNCVSPSDTVSRWGGDEFIAITENLSESLSESARRAEALGQNIIDAVNEPVENPFAKGTFFPNSVSIGLTLMYGHIHSVDELLKRADIEMNQAKQAGKNRLRYFDVVMQRELEERLAIESDLKRALRRTELELYYQPQYDAEHALTGAEVLLRWHHPSRGLIYPADFIPLAEETGDIVEIGNWLVRMACSKLQEWQANEKTRHLTLAINVSSRQFREESFPEIVSQAVRNAGLRADSLKLELTESLMLQNIDDMVARMENLKEAGVTFSLDDFGTGYSSLAYLKRLPLSQLKIDRSFVRDMARDRNDAALIKTIIGMAENLNLEVLAEGVEEAEQLSLLKDMGCHAYQGYYFSKPVRLEEFEKLAG